MRLFSLLALVVAPVAVLAVPQGGSALPAPPPCKRMSPPPSEAETKARFEKFVDAFIVKANITAAFEFIAEDYINNGAKTGSAASWNFLGSMWGRQTFTLLRKEFKDNMSWVNYRSGMGEVVDRFRWDAGCIAEHWDRGEKFPSGTTKF